MSSPQRRARRRPVAAPGWVQRTLALAYVLTGLALTTVMIWPVYDTPRVVLIAVFGGIAGAGIVLAARLRSWPAWRAAAALAAAYLIGVVPLAVPSALRSPLAVLGGVRDGVTGLVVGWKQLLTLEPPLGEYQSVLVPFFAIALLGTALAAAIALSPSRRSGFAVPVVLAGGVFGIAFAATDPGSSALIGGVRIDAPREVALGVLLVAASLAWLLVRSRLDRRAALAKATSTTAVVQGTRATTAVTVRRRILGSGMVALALIAGLVAAPAFADVTPRATLRTGVEPLLVIRDVSTPLGSYRAAFEADDYDAPMFTVAGEVAGLDRIPMATLDSWNGQRFSVASGADGTRFTRLPGGSAPAGAKTVEISIDEGYSGIWMPLPAGVQSAPQFLGARAQQLADAFFLDRDSGAGVQIAGSGRTRGLQAGDAYRVQVPATAESPLGEPGATGQLDLESYPQLRAWLKAQDQPRTAAGFTELIQRLRDRGYLSHSLEDDEAAATWIAGLSASAAYTFQSSYAGHSAARIETLFQQLVDQQNRVGADAPPELLVSGIGDDEQFAVAAALVARAVGYDSRVVVGVRLDDDGDGGVPPCDRQCTGANMAAWIEVRSPAASQWSAVDVDPQFRRQPVVVSVGQELPKNPTVPDQAQVDTAQPPTAQRDDQEGSPIVREPRPAWVDALLPVLRAVGLAAATLLLLLLPVLVLLVAKRLRRHARRAAAVPEVAVVGAWEELADTWTDLGAVPSGGTRAQRAAASGSARARELAALVDGAVFAEHPPTHDVVDRAWTLADREVDAALGAAGRWRRLGAALTPASLWRSMELPRPAQVWRSALRRGTP